MRVDEVKQVLAETYPGVNIKENLDDNGQVIEIIGEIDRKLIDSERDVAVVVTDKSPEHFHKATTEEYEVIRGGLRVFRNGQPTDLKEGDKITIEPGTVHSTIGKETWFYCYSEPDWSPDDYFPTDAQH